MGKRNSYNDDCEIDPTVGDELHGTVKTNRHNGVAHTQQQRQSVSLNLLQLAQLGRPLLRENTGRWHISSDSLQLRF